MIKVIIATKVPEGWLFGQFVVGASVGVKYLGRHVQQHTAHYEEYQTTKSIARWLVNKDYDHEESYVQLKNDWQKPSVGIALEKEPPVYSMSTQP